MLYMYMFNLFTTCTPMYLTFSIWSSKAHTIQSLRCTHHTIETSLLEIFCFMFCIIVDVLVMSNYHVIPVITVLKVNSNCLQNKRWKQSSSSDLIGSICVSMRGCVCIIMLIIFRLEAGINLIKCKKTFLFFIFDFFDKCAELHNNCSIKY